MIPDVEYFMGEAIKQAQEAAARDEVPVGAVITFQNRIIAKAYNQVELLKDPTAHAEILAITQAANVLGCKWLLDCQVYVTLEPCSMCAGALVLARVKTLTFGTRDPKAGACGSVLDVVRNSALNHRIVVTGGVAEGPCALLLQEFFQSKRKPAAENNA